MGVIVPNPTVETEDGSVSVSNVKKIEVTNGDLTNDGGRVVSINTAGTDTTPGGSNTDVQINDGGSFGGASTLTFASSTLSVENAIDVGASGAGGRVECSQNGQDLQIKHTGAGKVEVVNATTDTDTDLQITGPGTGAANLTLSGTGGGITFTDGTIQTTAPSAGGVTNYDYQQAASSDYAMCLGRLLPMGSNGIAFWTMHDSYNYAWPFYPSASGDISKVAIRVQSAQADSIIRIGIWDSDGTGNTPGTMLGYADVAGTATGTVSQTVTSATIALTAGDLYFYSVMNVGTGSNPGLYAASTSSSSNGSAQMNNLDNGGSSLEGNSSGWDSGTFTFLYANNQAAPLVGVEVT